MIKPVLDCCSLLLAAFLLGTAAQKDLLHTVFLRLYTGDTPDVYMEQSLENATLLASNMEGDKPTVIYIHGFKGSLESSSVVSVVEAFLRRKEHNVIGVDYGVIADRSYPMVANDLASVGIAVANALNEMIKAGMDQEKIYVVGHSMGAQVAGYVGRNTAFELPRITGLDPAGPLFDRVHLNASDARFVDIIHTDYGFYGIGVSSGTADFFPNSGRRIQPGCPRFAVFFTSEEFCSHQRSWEYYAESLLNENAFLAVPCPNYYDFIFRKCTDGEPVPMGFATPTDAKGSYYLTTRKESPFGAGAAGTKHYGGDAF